MGWRAMHHDETLVVEGEADDADEDEESDEKREAELEGAHLIIVRAKGVCDRSRLGIARVLLAR